MKKKKVKNDKRLLTKEELEAQRRRLDNSIERIKNARVHR